MNRSFILFFSFLFFLHVSVAQNAYSGLTEGTPETAGMSSQHLQLLDAHIEKYMENGTTPPGMVPFSI